MRLDTKTQLAGLALASLSIYLIAFVRPYSLIEWWRVPLQTIAKMTNADPIAGVMYVAAFACLFLIYWQAGRSVASEQSRSLWLIVIVGAIGFNAALLFLYPVDSADVFDNIIRGRLQTHYGANPFYQIPASFPNDPFYPYVAWENFQSAYGPWWELLAAVTARLAGNEIVVNVIVFKLVSVFAYAATGGLLGLLLVRHAPERALHGTVLFLWNPLGLYTTAGNGHNDAVMLFFVALGFYWLAEKRFTLAILAQTAGALIKFIPVLIVPILLVAAFKQMRSQRERIRFSLVTVGACALPVLGSYSIYWRGGDILGVQRRSDLFTTSLSSLIARTLEASLGAASAERLASGIVLVLLGGWIVWQAYKLWKNSDDSLFSVVQSALASVMFYLLVSVMWFQAWYAVWALPLVALLPNSPITQGGILLSLAATWKMPIFDFVLMIRPGNLPPADWREWRITLGTLGVPWFYFIQSFLKRHSKGYEPDFNDRRQTSRPGTDQDSTQPASAP